MSLTKCKECSAQISSKAKDCPSCGIEIRKPERGFFGLLFKYVFVTFNIAMVYFVYLSVASASDALDTAARYEQEGILYEAGLMIFMLLGSLDCRCNCNRTASAVHPP